MRMILMTFFSAASIFSLCFPIGRESGDPCDPRKSTYKGRITRAAGETPRDPRRRPARQGCLVVGFGQVWCNTCTTAGVSG